MPKKILIVDDESDVVTYLSMVLKANSFMPLAVTSAPEAMAMIKRDRPDLISLDIMMPKETGISLYKKLKRDKQFDSIPVIIVSGIVQSGEFDFRSFVTDKSIPPPEYYLEKPIDVDHYIDIINKLTQKKSHK